MSSGYSKVKVKSEADDASAAMEKSGPPGKRPRLEISSQRQSNLESVTTAAPGENSPLNEPSPLGLRLKKSPSLLELIQMRLSQEHAALKSSSSKTHKGNNNPTEKLKASNFPASLLSIGTWEYKSKYEGDLVAKCYFAKHKLVWEVLDGALKNKIEIQWSDIVAIKANYGGVEGSDSMEVVLARQPLFFRETNPQPRKHTLWQPTSDFTTCQASICRRHLMQCTQGLLARHFEKLTQCDPRLNFLSQQPEIAVECPYFDQRVSQTDPNRPFGLNNQEGPPFFAIPGPESSSLKNESQDFPSATPDNYSSSPSSEMDIEDVSSIGVREPINLFGESGRTKASSGIAPSSISMSDLMSHIGRCISGQQRASGNSSFPGARAADQLKSNNILEEISRYLFNDSSMASSASSPDRQSLLLSRVNSLYSLLQKDSGMVQNHHHEKNEAGGNESMAYGEATHPPPPLRAMSRKDSVGELLLNLPRIASLPHILPVVSEGSYGEKR